MIRKAILELIKHRCFRLDKTGMFHDRYIEGACDMVWQTIAYQFYVDGGIDPYFYSKKYEAVAVAVDVDGNYYSDLPEVIIHLPRANSGILRIDKNINREFEFIPVTERDFTLMFSQEIYQIGTKIIYYNTKDRVYYGHSMTPAVAAAGVDMSLCIPFSKFGLEEELPIPANQGATFLSSVVQFLVETPPTDLRNTNSQMA